jgi:hypothetical protein
MKREINMTLSGCLFCPYLEPEITNTNYLYYCSMLKCRTLYANNNEFAVQLELHKWFEKDCLLPEIKEHFYKEN